MRYSRIRMGVNLLADNWWTSGFRGPCIMTVPRAREPPEPAMVTVDSEIDHMCMVARFENWVDIKCLYNHEMKRLHGFLHGCSRIFLSPQHGTFLVFTNPLCISMSFPLANLHHPPLSPNIDSSIGFPKFWKIFEIRISDSYIYIYILEWNKISTQSLCILKIFFV